MDYESLLKLVKNRRSIRRFKPDPVPKETVKKVLEVARYAPSAGNSQPWEFVVVEETTTKKKLSKLLSAFYSKARKVDPTFYFEVAVQPHLWMAPVLIVVCGDRRLQQAYPASAEINTLLRQSLSNCIYAIQLAAASFGLGTAWATTQGEAREREIKKLLGIPDEYTVDHIIPLGYPDEAKEKRAKTLLPIKGRAQCRRELDEIVHYEHYAMEKFRSDEEVKEFIWSKSVTRIPES